MAYIKKTAEDEQQQGTMNTLGTNQPMGQAAQETQNQAVNISGQQSSSVGQNQQPSNQPKKGVGSGQYTDVKKYIQANRGATQRLGQAATQDFQKKAESVGQAVQKKEQQLSDVIQQNRQSIEQAKQFGQNTLQSAQNQVDKDELQKQQEDYQKRIQSMQNVSDQTQNISQYQTDLDARKQALQGMQTQYDQSKQQVSQQQAEKQNLEQQFAQQGITDPDQHFASKKQQLEGYQQDPNHAINYKNDTYYQQLKQDVESYDKYKQLQDPTLANQTASQYNQFLQEQQGVQGLQNQLSTSQDQQALFARRQALENELGGLQEKMASAPEQVTDEDVQRYRSLVEGKERYDQVAYDQAREQVQADELNRMAQGVEKEDVRRQLLQQAFGKQGDYTRGEVALDDVLLKGSPEAAQQFVSGVQGSSQDLQEQLRNARRGSLQGIAGLRQGQAELQSTLGEGVQTSLQGLQDEIDRRVASGEGSKLDAIRNALSEGVITADQAQQLGIEKGRTYGVDVNEKLSDLSGLTTRGSVSSRSDLARAQALSRLAGMTEQSIFANPDTVGQMSEAEKSRLAEIQGDLSRGRRDYEQKTSDTDYNRYIQSGGIPEEMAYKAQNTELFNTQLQNLISSKGLNNINEQDLLNINRNMLQGAYGNNAYGAKWGLGNMPAAAGATSGQLAALDANQRQFAVEGTDVAVERQQELERQQSLDARRRVMEALSQPRTYSSQPNAVGMFGYQMYGLQEQVRDPANDRYQKRAYKTVNTGITDVLNKLRGIK